MSEIKRYRGEFGENKNLLSVNITGQFNSEFSGTPIHYGELEDGRKVVVKYTTGASNARREYSGLVLANDRGIPSAKAIGLIAPDESHSEGLIMERVVGRSLNETTDPRYDFQLGQVVNKLHKIKLDTFGPLTDDSVTFSDGSEYLNFWLDKTLPHIQHNPEAVSALGNLFSQSGTELTTSDPRLLHRDLKDQNVIVDEYENVKLIDFEWAQGGIPHDDIGVYLYHAVRVGKPMHRVQSFMDGYSANQDFSDEQKYAMLFSLVLSSARTVAFCARFNQDRFDQADKDMQNALQFVDKTLSGVPGYSLKGEK